MRTAALRKVILFAALAAHFGCGVEQEEPDTKLTQASDDAAASRTVQDLAPFQGVWIMESESHPGAYVCGGSMIAMRQTPNNKPELRLNCLSTTSNLPAGYPFAEIAGRQVFGDVNGATGSVRAPTAVQKVLETFYATLLPGPLLIQTSIFPAAGLGHGQTVTTQTLRVEGTRSTYEYEVQGTKIEPRRVVFIRQR